MNNLIVSDKSGGVYLGGFFNHYVDNDHVACFEQMSGEDQQIAIRFVSFADVKGGQFSLKEEAEQMYQRGGALFVKLEPWSAAGASDDSFNLNDLKAGRFDKIIIAFAKACHKSGRPVFVTFGHEPQITNEYPWGKDPELYKEAFRYVHDLVNKNTDNVTWVWNPNVVDSKADLFQYDPGPGYYNWIALDGYHPRSGSTFREIFENSLQQITAKYPYLDIMIGEFASNAANRTAVYNELSDYLAGSPHRIKAFLYFNVNERGNNWSILNPQDQRAYAAALKKNDRLFRHTLQLADGSRLERGQTEPPPTDCRKIEANWYTPYWKRAVDQLSRDISNKEKCFEGIVNLNASGVKLGHNCDVTEANKWHELLATRYMAMSMFHDSNAAVRDDYINKAFEQIEIGLATTDKNDIKPNWPPIPKIRYYFDLKMRQAEILRDYGQAQAAITLCREILAPDQLYNSALRRAHDVDDESVGGIAARTKGIMADALRMLGKEALVTKASLAGLVKAPDQLWVDLVNSGYVNAKGIVQLKFTGDYAAFARWLPGVYTDDEKKRIFAVVLDAHQNSLTEAEQLYEQVIAWSENETRAEGKIGRAWNWLALFWKSGKGEMDLNPKLKILYIGALAKLGKADFLIRRGKIGQAFQTYTGLLNWERVGMEKGYMDLAMKALIGAMAGCARAGKYEKAAESFDRDLPWQKLNGYVDLKKALSLEGVDLSTKTAVEKWELFKNRLRLVRLAPRYMDQLQSIYVLQPSRVK